jgi:triphosphoribosyl-dephospho-CoA synthase
MDHGLMSASAEALRPWLSRFAALAFELSHLGPPETLAALRPLGVAAEEDMFRITCGVNTHKGAVFTLGLLVAASARVLAYTAPPGSRSADQRGLLAADAIRSEAAAMASGIVATELGAGRRTAGERLYAQLGTRGVRGQAESAFPSLAAILPILRRARKPGLVPASAPPAMPVVVISPSPDVEAARLEALLASMAELEDSCILSRGGPEALAFVRSHAAAALAAGAPLSDAGRKLLLQLDADLVSRHLSPGGSADLLAAGIFLDAVESTLIPPRFF